MEAPTSDTDPRPYTFRQPALVMQYQAVPEPSTAALTAIGLFVAVVARRSRPAAHTRS